MSKGTGHSPLLDPVPDPSRYAVVFGANVTRLREQERLNKKTLALMVGIGRPFLDEIEKGVSNARLDVIVGMADALCTSPADLLTRHEQYEPSYLALEKEAAKIKAQRAEKAEAARAKAAQETSQAGRASEAGAETSPGGMPGHAPLF